MIDTRVEIAQVEFKNPVIAASGTFGFGKEYGEYLPISKLGGICTKGLTLNKREGNKGIRIYETTGGILNSIGLQNPGIDGFIKEELSFMENEDTVILANVGGSTIEEYIKAVEKLNDTSIDMIELNISCPNVKEGGMAFGIKSEVAEGIVSKVRGVCKKPLIVKLSPNAEDIVHMAQCCERAGADGLSLVNTFSAMAIDIYSKKPVFNNILAGLSGPCIKPIALRMVYEVSKAVNIPVIGIGGIMDYKDAIEFIMAGAYAVQIGSGNFINPHICLDIIDGIERFMEEEGIKSIEEIRGVI
ncbi:dihydroorotate dehydrogenase (NAD+) catalytic subunit [Keratinibaculum paraultunense]|uniref:Dihydroorotate dehydrogenase n=1 Tax=Keratinibaculum paraultunense TaxID=1278232 RepID=A0A4R3KZC6_9FIRM|nr:dihydroorotate dehydrogenase [Keratinibaculum paraultunense]QQY80332.1 dihydroorotate dehydrogenase [Keratinibaculum paraultunense]TCS90854.1 dihydroorotate dehydrogenase (NAD+) catalytic subunit [Keratinibaculum paraultunense]